MIREAAAEGARRRRSIANGCRRLRRGPTVDAARNSWRDAADPGLRDGTDFDYEMQLAGMNGQLAPPSAPSSQPALPQTRPITATLVRQIARLGGDVLSSFRPMSPESRHKIRFEPAALPAASQTPERFLTDSLA